MKLKQCGILVAFLCLVLVLALPRQAHAATVTASGTCGDNLTWTLTDDGTLTISGTGAVKDYDSYINTAPWYRYRSSVLAVVVEDGVTSIGEYAFYDCTKLTTATIGDDVTTIGESAFLYCRSLASINFGSNVKTIGSTAFSDCDSLISVEIGEGVTTIENYAFFLCDNLTSVTIPASVTSIGDYVFRNNSSLTGIWVDENNLNYSSDSNGVLFNKDKTELIQAPSGLSGDYTVPEGMTFIESYAFSGCNNLSSVEIPNGVTSIVYHTFSGCKNLATVKLPETITSIGSEAFAECSSLSSITLPDGLSEIKSSAFFDCTSLTSVVLPDSVTRIGEYAFDHCSSLQSITIPKGVTSLENYVFNSCKSLQTFVIPDHVTSISTNAFSGCSNLTGFIVDENNPNYCSDNGVLFDREKTQLILAPGGISGSYTIPIGITMIGENAFSGCSALTEVTISDSVTNIGKSAFSSSGLESVIIPDSVVSIGSYAFTYCSNLTSVTLGNGVTSIGTHVFRGCSNLTDISIPDGFTAIGSAMFSGCTNLASITIPDSVTSIDDLAFYCCSGLSKVIYCGTEEQWSSVTVGEYNDELQNAQIQYHAWTDGVCSVCGATKIELFDLAGMTMSLGNSLAANFVVYSSNLDGDGYYAVVTKEYANSDPVTVTIPYADWQDYGTVGKYFTFSGVSAKEMTDVITVDVYNADNVQVMNTYTRTIEDYCYQQLVKEEALAAPNAENLALYTDILKYGAAAQNYFDGYNADNLATARLSEAQLAYGTQEVTMTDIRQKGTGYMGATLSLKSEISMNFVFQNATIGNAAYATISFTDHYGNLKETTVPSADFVAYGTAGKYIIVDGMGVADCSTQITVTLYAEDGTVLSTNVDSIEAYIARMSGADEIYPAIMKLATSAYNYFH